ncbi:MAG TPA: chalcone isomerase family protein [Thermoanaerobaculia bacterium]|nr:chalcone isomerase family protein [Thermoanaerobaculia bacterium]
MRKTLIGTLFAFALTLPAAAATLADVTLPDRVDANGQTLLLNGIGLRKKFFIKVYVGGLYLPAKEKSAAKITAADAPRRMVLHFVYGVSGKQMCDAWQEGLADNTPNATAEVKQGFNSLCGFMEAIDKGHELVLTYLPGQGTSVEVNGKAKGTLPGKATADALLATWIGPHPGPGEDFKSAVLGSG